LSLQQDSLTAYTAILCTVLDVFLVTE